MLLVAGCWLLPVGCKLLAACWWLVQSLPLPLPLLLPLLLLLLFLLLLLRQLLLSAA